MKLAILSNVIKSNPTEAAKAFLDVVRGECEIFVAEELKDIIPENAYYTDKELFEKADVAVVFGGDGTTLTAARRAAPFSIPVLSINTGHLGFLATVSAQDARKAAASLLSNSLELSERIMLNVRVIKDGKEVFCADALNDIIINRTSGKLTNICVNHGGTSAASYRADGVIISTPTGSTAYSLSCGGPLVLPTMDLFIVTPICPHYLGSRPMIVPSCGNIEVLLSGKNADILLSADGQEDYVIKGDEKIVITKAPYKAKLLTLPEQNFFNLVKKKLTID